MSIRGASRDAGASSGAVGEIQRETPGSARPFDAIPYVTLPDNYGVELGPYLVSMYETHGPIFRTTYLGNDLVYLIGPEANEFVLVKDRDKFSHHEGWGKLFAAMEVYGDGLVTMDGKEHDQDRRIMAPVFRNSAVDGYLPLMSRIVDTRIQSWRDLGEFDVYQETLRMTFDMAAQAFGGIEAPDELDLFRELFNHLLTQGMRARTSRRKAELSELLLRHIEARRRNPTDDLIGRLVQARDGDGNPLSDERIIAHVNILLLAGHETSASISAWFLHLLSRHPEFVERLRQEQMDVIGEDGELTPDRLRRLKVLDYGLLETERLYPPVGVGPRGVSQDFVFEGYRVPAGCYAFYSAAATHSMPFIFKDPARFDPDRFAPPREEHKRNPYSLVTFGGGPRICIGMAFGQAEIKMMVSTILRRYDLLPVENQRAVQFYRALGVPLYGLKLAVAERTGPDA